MANIEIEKGYLHEAELFEEKLLVKENLERQKRIEHYKELNEIVESRKSHAEWKVNRLKLDEKRKLFLTEDDEMLKTELKEFVPPTPLSTDSAMMISQTSDCLVADEVELDEEVTNLNYDNEIKNLNSVTLKKSESDYFNANSDSMEDFQKNKTKVLGSDIQNFTSTLIESQKILDRETTCDDNLNKILTEGQKNKIKSMSHEMNLEVEVSTTKETTESIPLKSNLNLDLTNTERIKNKNRNVNS